jgi:hypothetical protein
MHPCKFLHYAYLLRGPLAPLLDLARTMRAEAALVLISIKRKTGRKRIRAPSDFQLYQSFDTASINTGAMVASARSRD